MAVFYVLPPRETVIEVLREWVSSFLPGVPLKERDLLNFLVEQTQQERAGAFILHREDFSEGRATIAELMDAFGAEPGDQVIEIFLPSAPGRSVCRSWRIPHSAASVPALHLLA